MKIFVTGATGYIGGAVAARLKAQGQQVIGLARSDASAQKLEAAGITVQKGDLIDAQSVAAAAQISDAVIHTASPGDVNSAQADQTAVEAILGALAGTKKAFIWTGGSWEHGDSGLTLADENSPVNPPLLVAWRPAVGQKVLDAAQRDVQTVVIKPGVVYGNGKGLLNPVFFQPARQYGVVRYIGNGLNHWTAVHIDDLADLYVLALEKAKPGSMYFGVAGEPVRFKDIAAAVARSLGLEGKVQEWPLAEAQQAIGPFADALVLDQRLTGAKAMRELGWQPKAPSILEDMERGSYK